MHTVHRTQPWSQAFPSSPPSSRERGKESGNKVAYNLMSGHLMRIYCFMKGARFKYNVFGDIGMLAQWSSVIALLSI